jgi:hypothetical protein
MFDYSPEWTYFLLKNTARTQTKWNVEMKITAFKTKRAFPKAAFLLTSLTLISVALLVTYLKSLKQITNENYLVENIYVLPWRQLEKCDI